MGDLHSIVQTVLPGALSELAQSHENIEKIAQYCRNAYTADQSDAFGKTQTYIRDALSNVAYHVHTVGLHLTNFLQLQVTELDKLDLQIRTLTDVSCCFLLFRIQN
jgi:hypothetical protein